MPKVKSTTTQRLSKALVEALAAPETGQAVYWDAELTGFGVRISASSTKTYFVQGRLPNGKQVKLKIGRHGPYLATEAARAKAKAVLGGMASGADPAAARRDARKAETERQAAPTVANMCARYLKEYAELRKRARSGRGDRSLVECHILPAIGRRKVAEITFDDVELLHRQISAKGSPIAANRTLALLNTAFNLAIRWRYRTDNPVKGVQRNPEERRERFLTPAELRRLGDALNQRHDDIAAAAIAFLMLTGARRNEVLTARWQDIDMETGVWTKPSAHTKQKKLHRVPLSGAARGLIAQLAERHAPSGPPADGFVFGPSINNRMRVLWEAVRTEAKLPGLRVHDLRHSFASVLACGGQSLPIIGALLGHSSPATTARYAHLLDEPLRQATERVGVLWTALSDDTERAS